MATILESPRVFATRAGTKSPPSPEVLKNIGTVPVHVAAIHLAGATFGVADDACTGHTLTPGYGCTVEITFYPPGSTTYTGGLTFNDDSGSGSQTVALSGRAVG